MLQPRLILREERKKAVNDLKNEIGGMAVEIAGKVVEREITKLIIRPDR